MPPTLTKFLPAMAWFIVVTILFLMPGSQFPQEDWFEKIYLDKLVHIAFIFFLVYLFYYPLRHQQFNWLLFLVCAGIIYGVSIEFIQQYWVKGRSFELGDIACDIAGCAAAYLMGSNDKMNEKK